MNNTSLAKARSTSASSGVIVRRPPDDAGTLSGFLPDEIRENSLGGRPICRNFARIKPFPLVYVFPNADFLKSTLLDRNTPRCTSCKLFLVAISTILYDRSALSHPM
jgi:hypothetical protein